MRIHSVQRTTKFIPQHLVKRSPELIHRLMSNRIKFLVDHDSLDVHHLDYAANFLREAQDFCEGNQGIWSADLDSWWTDDDTAIVKDVDMSYSATGLRFQLIVLFEFTEDADRFTRDFLMMRKLSN